MAPPESRNGSGPSWKWFVGIQIAALAFCFGLGVKLLLGALDSIDTRLSRLESNTAPLQTQLADHSMQIGRLWDAWGKDHDQLSRDQPIIDLDHEWITTHAMDGRRHDTDRVK